MPWHLTLSVTSSRCGEVYKPVPSVRDRQVGVVGQRRKIKRKGGKGQRERNDG